LDKAAAWLQKSLAYSFNDEQLLRAALTHRSAPGINNERLEFLGDAVLQLVISMLVFREAADASEGQLTRLRATLVKRATLAEIAATLGLGDHLIMDSGARKSGGHRQASILADALEAIIGAVYLDAGFAGASGLIHAAYGDKLHGLAELADLRDPKSRLQEYLQGRGLTLPHYDLHVSGKAHQQSFEVTCSIRELDLATTGTGSTRRNAEQQAAATMLGEIESSNG
jgi:ribonuclease-3